MLSGILFFAPLLMIFGPVTGSADNWFVDIWQHNFSTPFRFLSSCAFIALLTCLCLDRTRDYLTREWYGDLSHPAYVVVTCSTFT